MWIKRRGVDANADAGGGGILHFKSHQQEQRKRCKIRPTGWI